MSTQAVSKISGYSFKWPFTKSASGPHYGRVAKNPWTAETAAKADARKTLLRGFLQFLLPRFFFENASPAIADILVIFLNIAGMAEIAKSSTMARLLSQNFSAASPIILNLQTFEAAGLLFASIFVVLAITEGIYARHSVANQTSLAKCIGWATLTTTIALYFLHQWNLCPYVVALAVASFISCSAWRDFLQTTVHDPRPRRVLIAGAGLLGQALSAQIKTHASYQFLGFADCAVFPGRNMLGKIEDLPNIALQTFADEIIVAFPQQPEIASKVIEIARGLNVSVKLAVETFDCGVHERGLEQLGNIALLPVLDKRESFFRACLKRCADILLSILGLIVSSPIMAIVAMIIKLDSRGPVFYSSLRAGRKGELFTCYKFRTMARDAEFRKEELRIWNERSGPFFKLKNDPRITRSGKFLRRYSLDELPQFWNVLRGEMSLVGPRPHPVDDFKRYEVEHLRRLEAVPGMTGLWQVTARRDPSFQRNMALDLEYIEHGTLWMDLKVLFKTVSVILQGNGI